MLGSNFLRKARLWNLATPAKQESSFQLDHVLIPRDNLSRVRDAGIFEQGTVESDHAPLQIKLRIARNLSKQNASKGTFTNRELLRNPANAKKFRQAVLAHLGIESPPSPSPSPAQAIYEEIEKIEACRVDLLLREIREISCYTSCYVLCNWNVSLKVPPLEQL